MGGWVDFDRQIRTCVLADELHVALAGLRRGFGQGHGDGVTVHTRIEFELGGLDGFVDGLLGWVGGWVWVWWVDVWVSVLSIYVGGWETYPEELWVVDVDDGKGGAFDSDLGELAQGGAFSCIDGWVGGWRKSVGGGEKWVGGWTHYRRPGRGGGQTWQRQACPP